MNTKEVSWLNLILSGKPHFVIGGVQNPYLLRWYLLPRNPFVNLYLHKFLRDDDDRALHDHPWWFVSWMVRGAYSEVTDSRTLYRSTPSVCFRRALHRHRIVLDRDEVGAVVPCWTIVLTGPKARTWDFWCPRGFIPWHQFVAQDDHGNVGKGCGD